MDDRLSFDINADNYSQWKVTTNIDYLNKFYEFSEIENNDKIIDIACGSGDFLINCAQLIGISKGIDMSEKLIEIARKSVENNGIRNVCFEVKNIESLSDRQNEKYDAVICRMAMHHFIDPFLAFKNCMAFANKVCKISMQDIISHDIESVDNFFDELERLIDRTHKRVLSIRDFDRMFDKYNIQNKEVIVLDREIVLKDYLKHAKQSNEDKQRIEKLISKGMQDTIINKFIYYKNDQIVFKRKLILIKGRIGENNEIHNRL